MIKQGNLKHKNVLVFLFLSSGAKHYKILTNEMQSYQTTSGKSAKVNLADFLVNSLGRKRFLWSRVETEFLLYCK